MSEYVLKAVITEPTYAVKDLNVIKADKTIEVKEVYDDINTAISRYFTLKSMYFVNYMEIFKVELRKVDIEGFIKNCEED